MVSIWYLLKRLVYWIDILYTGMYNHKILVKFDLGWNPPIILGYGPFFNFENWFPFNIFWKD